MTRRLIWATSALARRREVFDRIEPDDPDAAWQLDEDIVEKAERLTRFPNMGRPGRIEGTREFVVRPNYLLVYQTEPGAIRILTVWHAARGWPPSELDEPAENE